MVLDKQFLFIIGAPRSGTTWLQGMLGAHPSVCTFGELKLYDSYIAPWIKAWEGQIGLQKYGDFGGLPIVWSEEELYEFLREFLASVHDRVLSTKPGATILLDKSPGYSGHVEYINRFVPNAKFIHIIRDGRDVVVSLLAASQGWGELWGPKDVESAASRWEKYVLAARKAHQYGDRYLEVRYEELLTNGVMVLKSVFEFIGLPIGLEDVTSIFDEHQFEKMKQRKTGASGLALPEGFFRKGQIGDWQNVLNPTQKYIFHDRAGGLLCELGYADNSWWIERGYQRFTLPLLYVISTRGRSLRKIIHAIKRVLGPRWQTNFRG